MPIIRAASDGEADAVRVLLAEGADVDQRAQGGQTALMVAAILGHVDIARLLLAAGADVRLRDNLGLTAREWADRRGSSEVGQLLSNASPAEVVPSPKKAPAKQAQPKVEAERRNPAAEAKTTPQQDVLSGTEEQLRKKADPERREVEEARREAEQERRASATETKIALQDDALRWIKFHKRIMADQERRKAEEARREAEQERRASPIETKIAPQQDAPSVADEQQRAKPDPQRREEEEARHASPIETKTALRQGAPSVADERQRTMADPDRSKAEEARPTATQSARIAATIEHLKILEESRQRVEAEVRAKSQRATRAAVEGGLDRNERDTRLEGPPAELSPPPAMLEPKTSESLNPPPIKRCPKCNTTYENALLTYCAYDATKLISADVTLFISPAANDWSRPTLWALVAIIAVLGASLGYLINNYLSREKVSSAPIAAQMAQPEIARKDVPMIDGALSGMEINVPEPEYPAQAKAEGVSGTVAVRVQVNKEGRVILVRSSRGDWRLRAAAVKAAQKATFSAEKLAGRGASGTITYVFRL